MMILATAIRCQPESPVFPGCRIVAGSPLSADYTLLAVSPMFIWDVVRNQDVHRAYWIWLGMGLPFSVVVHGLWDTDWWHATAQQLMGV